MPLDSASFVRLDAPNGLGASASGAAFATNTGDILEIACFGPGIFRLRVGPNTRPDYGLIVGRVQRCDVAQTDRAWTFSAGNTRLEFVGDPLSLRLMHDEHAVLASITDEHFRGFTRLPVIGRARSGQQWVAAFALASGEAAYGLGETFGPLNKRGQVVVSHIDDALGVNTALSYKSAPFCWGPGTGKGSWGVFFNTPGRVTHGVGYPEWSHRSYAAMVEDEALDVFLIAGRDPAQVIERYTHITGRAPDVPLWGLGLWVSKMYYRTAEEATAVASKLRARRIPCDVLTLDGRSTWDVQTRFDFQWDPQRYRDPAGSLARMKANALRICVWEYPYVSIHSPLFTELANKRYLLTTGGGQPYVFRWDTAPATSPFSDVLTPLPESGIVDFTNPAAFAWWRDAHEPLFRAGVDVIKCDFGEHVPDDAVAFNGDRGARLHNVYPLLYNRCVYEATKKFGDRDHGPPMVWSRAGWAGSQRYPIQWGGDPQSDWEGLAASIRGALSWGMSGAPYHASDIGGFYGSAQPSPELYVRWLQAAVFGSHMRVHGIGAREPWAFGEEAEAVARRWIEFRYRLLPYLRSVIAEALESGLPVMRAMPLAFPFNALTRGYETQFMCGDALLVAPIITPGGEVEVALPPGAWYDLGTRQRLAGRQVIRYRATLERFPVFGREGYALPLGPVVQHTGEIDVARPLDALWVFGKPARALGGFTQAAIAIDDARPRITAAPEVNVEIFGDAADIETRVRDDSRE